MKPWNRYEKTAQAVLDQLREHFGLECVEPKQSVPGASGTDWEIDIVGRSDATKKIVVIECRLAKSRQSQAKLAALAFTIQDTGAERGILVTPKPLQKGAQIVANATGIVHFRLNANSSANDFAGQVLDKLFIGLPSIGDTVQVGIPGIGRT